MTKKVLIMRPEDEAAAYIQKAKEIGWEAVAEPLFLINPLPVEDIDPQDYSELIFTSANGVKAWAAQNDFRDIKVYTVGKETAAVAKFHGFSEVVSADGTVSDLVFLLGQHPPKDGKALLYLSGMHISRDIELETIAVDRAVVYEAQMIDDFRPETAQLLKDGAFSAIMLFSSRAAAHFSNLIEQHECTSALSTTKALCISDSVVKSLLHLPWQDVQVAKRPDRTGMMALLENLK